MEWTRGELSRLMDSIPEGLLVVDADKRIVFFNKSAEEIIGLSGSDALCRPCAQVLRAECCSSDCPLQRVIQTGEKSFERVVQIVAGDGCRKKLSIATALLVNDDGSMRGAIETFRDLTNEKAVRMADGVSRTFGDIVSINASMQRLFSRLPTIAESTSNVLLEGDTGTGKELFARAIHEMSLRRNEPFVAVNCGALPDTLLESEMFGHVAGAFTDASRNRPGRFAKAEKGTLFLDEIGETSMAMQIKLLRIIQEHAYEPVGSDTTVYTDVRVIAATNRDLVDAMNAGRFRKDLYYRLNVIQMRIPPLRERRDDIPVLADYFIRRFNNRHNKRIRGLTDAAMGLLMSHDFPGNVRELENALEYAFVLCPKGYIDVAHLPDRLQAHIVAEIPDVPPQSFRALEKTFLIGVLKRNNGNLQDTARELGIHRTSLYRKMQSMGVSRKMVSRA